MTYRTYTIDFTALSATHNTSLNNIITGHISEGYMVSDTPNISNAHSHHIAFMLYVAGVLSSTQSAQGITIDYSSIMFKGTKNDGTYSVPYLHVPPNNINTTASAGCIYAAYKDVQLDSIKLQLEYIQEFLSLTHNISSIRDYLWNNEFLMCFYAIWAMGRGEINWKHSIHRGMFRFARDEFSVYDRNSRVIEFSLFDSDANILAIKDRILSFIIAWLGSRNRENIRISFNEYPTIRTIVEHEGHNTLSCSYIRANTGTVNGWAVSTLTGNQSASIAINLTSDGSSVFETGSCDSYIKGWNSFKKHIIPYYNSTEYNIEVVYSALTTIWRKQLEEYKAKLLDKSKPYLDLLSSFKDYYANVILSCREMQRNYSRTTPFELPEIKVCPGCSAVSHETNFIGVRSGIYIGGREHAHVCEYCVGNRYALATSYSTHTYIPLYKYLPRLHNAPIDVYDSLRRSPPPSSGYIRGYSYNVLESLKFQHIHTSGNVTYTDVPAMDKCAEGGLTNKLYFGVELEIEVKQSKITKETLSNLLHEHTGGRSVCFKADGSIKYGFEIVSAPMTEDVHCMPGNVWQKICESPWRDHMMAASKPNLGLHIHVNRAGMSGLTIGKLIFFVNAPGNNKFVTELAGRDANTYCRRYDKKVHSDVKVKKENIIVCDPATGRPTIKGQRVINYVTQDSRGGERYQAINVLPRNTIEFRIFKATLSWRSICAKIQWVKSLIEFVKHTSVRDLTYKEYIKWLSKPQNKSRYQYIYKWLVFKLWISRTDTPDPKLSEQEGGFNKHETTIYNETDEAEAA